MIFLPNAPVTEGFIILIGTLALIVSVTAFLVYLNERHR